MRGGRCRTPPAGKVSPPEPCAVDCSTSCIATGLCSFERLVSSNSTTIGFVIVVQCEGHTPRGNTRGNKNRASYIAMTLLTRIRSGSS